MALFNLAIDSKLRACDLTNRRPSETDTERPITVVQPWLKFSRFLSVAKD